METNGGFGRPREPGRGYDTEPAPAPPVTYDEEGVDRSLIRELLKKSPAERLDLADALAQDVEAMRGALRATGDGS